MIGKGMPSSQSRIPRPMSVASFLVTHELRGAAKRSLARLNIIAGSD